MKWIKVVLYNVWLRLVLAALGFLIIICGLIIPQRCLLGIIAAGKAARSKGY